MYGVGGAPRCCSFWLFSGDPVRGSSMFEEGLFLLLLRILFYFCLKFDMYRYTRSSRLASNG
jgi:hypothetical protein